jgi:hypothetical protein
MILGLAIFAGLIFGLMKAWLRKKPFRLPDLSLTWLGVVAFLPQWLVFYLPATRSRIPDGWASGALVFSQLLFLIFLWANRHKPGFWLFGCGLVLNLVVILLNGGWMPINPEMVLRLYPNAPSGAWEIGQRLGTSKDIVLNLWNMRLGFLGDQIFIPFPPPLHPAAFSLGDFLIAIGAAWFLSAQGDTQAIRIKILSQPA